MLRIHIYKDAKKEFRWRIKRSGRVLADSGEGYKTRAKLDRTLSNDDKRKQLDEIVSRENQVITRSLSEYVKAQKALKANPAQISQ